jgi:phosphoribosylformimino-5-aminoimidazole carboxamide ribotide isomerase
MFELIPAIDLKEGRCVRLYQGDFAQTTVYSDDPVAVARSWAEQGAPRIHVVDLDGAKVGRPANSDTVLAILGAVSVPVQLGGGLRREDDIVAALALGVDRVILGTAAVEDSSMVERMVARFGAQIVVGVDARAGMIATAGWTETVNLHAVELIARMQVLGVQRIIYTDIARDGTLTEPNYAALRELVRDDGPAIIASGGISNIEQLHKLAELGVEGAIIGKALYVGAIDLAHAVKELT